MVKTKVIKSIILFCVTLFFVSMETAVFARLSGVGSVGSSIATNLGNMAEILNPFLYFIGVVFVIIGLFKLKAHKDNPQQVPLSAGITYMAIGFAFLFMPSVITVGGRTFFGTSGAAVSTTGNITITP